MSLFLEIIGEERSISGLPVKDKLHHSDRADLQGILKANRTIHREIIAGIYE